MSRVNHVWVTLVVEALQTLRTRYKVILFEGAFGVECGKGNIVIYIYKASKVKQDGDHLDLRLVYNVCEEVYIPL